ncbi:hypothetical protein RIVM261_079000 [Rivularia sp. IAM M-261]|nr:hypothetical protein RIVM261_079000 [Rivularia sp. IAM M-261]
MNIESNSFRKLELIAHVKQIAEIHNISVQEAVKYCIQKLKIQIADNEEKIANCKSPPPSKLMMKLGEEKCNTLMDKFVYKVTSSEELSQAYYQAKTSGRLKQAKLKIEGEFHFGNSDFFGSKYLEVGTILEAEEYDEQLYQIWLSPTEREIVFKEELEIL